MENSRYTQGNSPLNRRVGTKEITIDESDESDEYESSSDVGTFDNDNNKYQSKPRRRTKQLLTRGIVLFCLFHLVFCTILIAKSPFYKKIIGSYMIQQHEEEELPEISMAPKPPPKPIIKIACIGDSLTRGSIGRGVAFGFDDYPSQLQNQLRERSTGEVKFDVRNFGVNGAMALHGLLGSYFSTKEFLKEVKEFKPNVVLVGFGTNDVKYLFSPELRDQHSENFVSSFHRLLQEVGARAKVFLAHRPPYVAKKNGEISDENISLYVHPLIDQVVEKSSFLTGTVDLQRITKNDELFTNDGLHLNHKGYSMIAEAWMKALVDSGVVGGLKKVQIRQLVRNETKSVEAASVSADRSISFYDSITPRQILEQECCRKLESSNGRFVGESLNYLRHIEERILHKQPFAHVRWGDGEMTTSVDGTPFGKRLSESLLQLTQHPLTSVNVGTWWLEDKNGNPKHFVKKWNQVVSEEISNKTLFHDFFYLPLAEIDEPRFKPEGIDGWVALTDRAAYKTVLVGPKFLLGIPFINQTEYISSEGIERDVGKTDDVTQKIIKVMKAHEPEPLLFLVSAGRSAKIIISDLISRQDNIHSFIDTGASLDGWAGVHSRDYNNPATYCGKVLKRDPERKDYWMKKGVCP